MEPHRPAQRAKRSERLLRTRLHTASNKKKSPFSTHTHRHIISRSQGLNIQVNIYLCARAGAEIDRLLIGSFILRIGGRRHPFENDKDDGKGR